MLEDEMKVRERKTRETGTGNKIRHGKGSKDGKASRIDNEKR